MPTMSKILERALNIHLASNGIFATKQFGFKPKLSTGTASTHFADNTFKNMDDGKLIGAI